MADSAIQPADLATVATTGAYSDLSGTPTLATVATTGAYSDLSGTPTLATVATSGAYSDLSGTPTISTFGATLIDDIDAAAARTTLGLGSAATTDSTDYATAAQGALADSALQSETITLATLKAEVAAATDFADFQTRIAAL